MKVYKPFKSGKVREMYDANDSIIMVATDRISAFDHILKTDIPKKGIVLTQLSKFWFDFTKDVVANHMLSVAVEDMPEFFHNAEFSGRSMKCRKLQMLPVECIVRGYLSGGGWTSYKETGKVCGIALPAGMQESQKLPEPIFTPSTKAEVGIHDENISLEQCADLLEKLHPGKGVEYAAKLQEYSLTLYKKCADYALSRGIIVADTKFEFGIDEAGEIVIGDEMVTPDCSRFWPADDYCVGREQSSYDKQFVRDWLSANPNNNYTLPDAVIEKTIGKYVEAYELLTGQKFAF